MRNKKFRGVDALKSHYGRMFLLPWTIGILFFVLIPVIKSIGYSFSDITTTDTGIKSILVGFKNYNYALNSDPKFSKLLVSSVTTILYSLPAIVVISMIIGIILSSEFRGRLFFRSLYFLPVIIASGAVLEWIYACTNPSLMDAGVGSNETTNMLDVTEVLSAIGLSGNTFVEYIQMAISKIFDLVWASGIQIVLFIAGMQSIPDSLYEVSKVEGATKWEEFWYITFPMLSRITVLVIVFTMVELITTKTNVVMEYVYSLMAALNYDESSAMLWIYLLFSSLLIGLVVLVFRHFCSKKWE